MPKIHILDSHVADLIAAGEVVERPASAVKELVENAVDAGAKQVTVEIQNGGMTYLRVTDNGCGMTPEDAETAFLRHATSKLRTKEDLAAIGTLGFRGEALAAIASVSRIDLLTKAAHTEGISLRLEAGKLLDRSPAGCPDGTTIVVRDLFYNTPARLKFMKRDTVEASHVTAALQRQALAHPEVAFRLIRDGETVLQTAGSGDLHGTVYQVYGRQLATEMLEVKSSWENLQLCGFVTKPNATRGNRNYQQFFVNGRPVRSKLMTAALEEAYKNRMMTGRFPACVLCLTLPAPMVDVNVHPAKTEVKFANERAVFDGIHYAVLSALNKAPAREPMKLETARPAPKQEAFRTMNTEQFRAFSQIVAEKPKAPAAEPVVKAFSAPKPAETPVPAVEPPKITPVQEPEKTLFRTAAVYAPPAEEKEPEQAVMPMAETPAYRVVGEVLNTYIILEQGEEVLFLDKHAAHERILFEDLKKTDAPVMAQQLLEPISAQLTAEARAALLENPALLEQFGFEAEDFGDCLLLRQIPAELDEKQAVETLEELAEHLLRGGRGDPASLRDAVLHTIACKAAIKGGWHTEPAERDALVKQVMSRDDIRCCPHGRPIVTSLTKKQLEKQFKRI